MDSKAFQTYAVIENLWNNGMDLIEIYAMLSLGALDEVVDKGSNSIDAVELVGYFENQYNLKNITVGAATKFLRLLEEKHKVVRKNNHRFAINLSMLKKLKDDIADAPDISNVLNSIVKSIQDFSEVQHRLKLTDEDVNKGLIDFFDKYGGDIIIEQKKANETLTIKYKKVTHPQRIRYVIADYIKKISESNYDKFEILLKFAVGNMVANAVSLQGFSEVQSNLKNLTVYIDAPIIFNLMNLSGDIPRKMAEDLLDKLRQLKAKIVIGANHHDEVTNSIQYAIGLLNTEYPDLTKANRIYHYAEDLGLTASDLQLKLQSFDSIKRKYEIQVLSLPPKEAGYSVIKEEQIRSKINNVYSENGRYNIPSYREVSIKRDAKVLSHVLMLSGKTGADWDSAPEQTGTLLMVQI